jgi:hypothetical protein
MKHWSQWALLIATVLPVACVLAYHARERIQRRQSLGTQSNLIYERSAESKGVAARITAKYRIADEVIAGRMSLLKAAAAFRSLDEQWPRATAPYATFTAAASEEEAHCLKVIAYVRTEAPPERVAELANRLQAELDALLQTGTLRLPDSEDASSSGGG